MQMATETDNTAIVAGALIVPMGIGLVVYRGWFVAMLWRWFVTPTFGLRELTIAQAIGLTMVAATLAKDNRKSDEKGWVWFVGQLVFPLIGLSVAWIVKQFMP
jgi:hypothetical protein